MPDSISVIIPTINRKEVIVSTVKYLENQSVQSFELIVVDQSDGLNTKLNNYSSNQFQFIYEHILSRGLPNARNVGAKKAKGELLIFLDDDIIPDNMLVQSYLKLFNTMNENIWLIGGKIYEKDSNIMQNSVDIIGGTMTNYGKTKKNFTSNNAGIVDWVAGGNFSIRKRMYLQVGGFDTNYIGNAILEDVDFSSKIKLNGGKIYYSPEPVIEHLRVPTGGTRRFSKYQDIFYRNHNSVYYFRKYEMKKKLFFVFFYLIGVGLKDSKTIFDWFGNFIFGIKGFISGFKTKIKV